MTTQVNEILLLDTLEYIDTHPKEWNQMKWICHTAACFAGTACLLSGATKVRKYEAPDNWNRNSGMSVVDYAGEHRSVYPLATELLGIDEWSAQQLFSACNTSEDLHLYVKQLITQGHVDPA